MLIMRSFFGLKGTYRRAKDKVLQGIEHGEFYWGQLESSIGVKNKNLNDADGTRTIYSMLKRVRDGRTRKHTPQSLPDS